MLAEAVRVYQQWHGITDDEALYRHFRMPSEDMLYKLMICSWPRLDQMAEDCLKIAHSTQAADYLIVTFMGQMLPMHPKIDLYLERQGDNGALLPMDSVQVALRMPPQPSGGPSGEIRTVAYIAHGPGALHMITHASKWREDAEYWRGKASDYELQLDVAKTQLKIPFGDDEHLACSCVYKDGKLQPESQKTCPKHWLGAYS